MTRKAKNPVRTTMRSFDIVETLHELNGARLTEVAEHLDLPDSTVHSHLSTLAALRLRGRSYTTDRRRSPIEPTES